MLAKDTKLRFWCQKVLPLVYDDSLSYYELLNKVVLHLNQHTEDINALIDFYDTFSEDVEEIIHQMMEDGEFNEIIADTIGSLIADEYDPTKAYIIFDYCIYNSKLYRANGGTSGDFDPEKWDERNVAYDLTTIQNYLYSLNAGNVSYDGTQTYDNGTVGAELAKISNLKASNIGNDSSVTGTKVKDALNTLLSTINALNAGNIANNSNVSGQKVNDALNNLLSLIQYCTWINYNSTQSLTSQIESLPHSEGAYFGKIVYSDVVGLPQATSGCVIALNYNVNYKHVYYLPNGSDTIFLMEQRNGVWTSWSELPSATAITQIRGDITTISGQISTINSNISTINGNITNLQNALNTNTTPSAITVETSSDVTSTNPKFFKINKLVVINANLSVANNIPTGVTFITGLPRPTSTTWVLLINTSTNVAHPCYVSSAGEMKPSGALTAGQWILCATYVADYN